MWLPTILADLRANTVGMVAHDILWLTPTTAQRLEWSGGYRSGILDFYAHHTQSLHGLSRRALGGKCCAHPSKRAERADMALTRLIETNDSGCARAAALLWGRLLDIAADNLADTLESAYRALGPYGWPKGSSHLSLGPEAAATSPTPHRTDFLVCDPRLPTRCPVANVEFRGLARVMKMSAWYRENAEAMTNSPAPWEQGTIHPFVVEVDFAVPDRDNFAQWLPITIAYPSHGGPGTEDFNVALRQAVHRAMKHEADEGLVIDGERLFDPHR